MRISRQQLWLEAKRRRAEPLDTLDGDVLDADRAEAHEALQRCRGQVELKRKMDMLRNHSRETGADEVAVKEELERLEEERREAEEAEAKRKAEEAEAKRKALGEQGAVKLTNKMRARLERERDKRQAELNEAEHM